MKTLFRRQWFARAMFSLGLWFALSSFSLSASPALIQYSARLWQTEDGLPQNTVQAVAQTRDGYLWIGTQQGLARFDGVRFAHYYSKNTPEIRDVKITALSVAADGSLWIATEHGGVTQLKNGKFFHYSETNGLCSEEGLRGMVAGRDGSIWICTTNGLSQFKDGQFKNFFRDNGLSSSVVRGADEDLEGRLWVATASGVDCLQDGRIVQHVSETHGLRGNFVRAVLCDSKSNLWVGVTGGLSCLRDGTVTNYTKENGLADNTVTTLFEDRNGAIWIGSYGGLNRFFNGQILPELNSEGQPFDLVNCICEDREGNIWVGSKDGLTRLRAKRFVTYTRREGLSHNNVISMIEDRNKVLWIGTWGGGLNQMKDGVITPYSSKDRLVNSSVGIDLVLALHEDHRKQLWIGTDFNGGLFRHRNGKFYRYGTKEGLAEAAVRVIYQDCQTNLWVGTSSGLFFVKDHHLFRFGKDEGLMGNVIRAILQTKDGDLWVGTDNALNRLHEGKFTNFTTKDGLLSPAILALHEDRENTLWIGTRNGGLSRFREGKFTNYTMEEGLPSNELFEIVEDDFGFFWISSRTGIFRVKKSDLEDFANGRLGVLNCNAYGKSEGLLSVECSGIAKPSALKTRDGRLWFATTKGLASTNPRDAMKANEVPPPVVIEEILVDRKPTGRAAEIRVPPGRGELEFHYTALSFQSPEKNRFRYKLEGMDSDWVEAETRRVAYYNNLPPGSYRFRVTACNNDGVWNDKGDFATLIFEPHVWETWWFHSLVGLAVLGTVGGTIRYVSVRKLKRQLEAVERERAIEQERARIAQDMHDDLGARLTEIMLMSDIAERTSEGLGRRHVSRIARASREIVQSLDTIVWAVNPRNDSLNNLAVYIYEYLERFLGMSGIRYRLDVPDQLPESPLSSEMRHNLFLVVKESLNNIVKHAEASEVWFRLSLENSVLAISIEDNGKGFEMSEVSVTGNGLQNMQVRIEKIGGSYCIGSEPGRGTQTKIRLPIPTVGTT